MGKDRDVDIESPKRRMSRTARVLLILLMVVLLIIAAGVVYALNFYGQVKETQRVLLDDVVFEEEEYDVGEEFPEHIVNIALLGFDRGWNREYMGQYLFRPDMIAIFSINFETDKISVVRITRDSYVPFYGTRDTYGKINASYSYGYRSGMSDDPEADGIYYTLQTIRHVLGGVPIHYYASVDIYSVIELVDAIGGVYYDVEEPIYDIHDNIGEILVPAGPQLMDGRTYMRYLQYRDDATHQDYGRIERQMDLLKETLFYLREQGKVTDIPKIYRIYKDFVDTNLDYKQIAALAYYLRDANISEEDLQHHMLVGDGVFANGRWYQVLRQNVRVRVIKEVFGVDVPAWPEIVLVDSPEYLAEQERLRLEQEAEEGLFPGGGLTEDEVGDEEEGTEGTDGGEESSLVQIPEVRGMTLLQATATLVNRGLVIGNENHTYYQFLDAGLVIETFPLAGSSVPPGTVVDLLISDGPAPE